MAEIKAFFDLSDFEDWAVKARRNAVKAKESLGKQFRPLAEDAVEVLQRNIVEHMRKVGLQRRTGRMEEETKVSSIREKTTSDGVEWEVTVEGPPYAMLHETGGVISASPGKALRIPIHPEKPEQEELQRQIEALRAQKRTFILYKGKGGQPLKRPLLMALLGDPVKGENAALSEEEKESLRSARRSGATDAQIKVLKKAMQEQREAQQGGAQQMVPLFFLMKEIRIPQRAWLTSAIEETQLGVSDVLADLSTEYGRDTGFTFTVKRGVQ